MEHQKRLYKTKDGAVLGGVLQGFSEYYNMDVTAVRLIFVLLTFFVIGSPIIIYLVLYLILPDKAQVIAKQDPYNIENDFYE